MNKEKALSLAAAICSKKEHCSWEIQEKLVKWEIPEKEIDRIMTFLHQHRFIDDARYAQAYAEDKFRFNHWGKQKIALMLHRKKIDPDLISQVLEALDTDTYQEACLTLLKQKMKSLAGEGAMLALNSFPGVICGHVEDPVDAYTFAHVNDGNAVALPA